MIEVKLMEVEKMIEGNPGGFSQTPNRQTLEYRRGFNVKGKESDSRKGGVR